MKSIFSLLLLPGIVSAISLRAEAYIGGSVISSAQVPSVLRIQIDSDPERKRECTAVKVSARFYLTAAHCVSRQYIPFIHFSRGGSNASPLRTRLTVRNIHIHPQFGYGGGTDLALIETQETTSWPNAMLAKTPPNSREKIWVGGYGIREWEGQYRNGALVYDERERNHLGKETFTLKAKKLADGTYAQIYFGDSGAPALALTGETLQVFGINAFYRRENVRRSPKETLTRVDEKSAGGIWLRQMISAP